MTRRGFFAALTGAAVATQAPPLPAIKKAWEAWCYVEGGHLFYLLEATPEGMKDDPWRPMVSVVSLEQQHQVEREGSDGR